MGQGKEKQHNAKYLFCGDVDFDNVLNGNGLHSHGVIISYSSAHSSFPPLFSFFLSSFVLILPFLLCSHSFTSSQSCFLSRFKNTHHRSKRKRFRMHTNPREQSSGDSHSAPTCCQFVRLLCYTDVTDKVHH